MHIAFEIIGFFCLGALGLSIMVLISSFLIALVGDILLPQAKLFQENQEMPNMGAYRTSAPPEEIRGSDEPEKEETLLDKLLAAKWRWKYGRNNRYCFRCGWPAKFWLEPIVYSSNHVAGYNLRFRRHLFWNWEEVSKKIIGPSDIKELYVQLTELLVLPDKAKRWEAEEAKDRKLARTISQVAKGLRE